MTVPPSILVGQVGDYVWVRVEGKGSFQNSTGVKEFAKEMVDRGHCEFVVDLDHCPVMDSTFMGTLAGIALRLKALGKGHLHVINAHERNRELLTNLGLDRLFFMGAEGPAPAAGDAKPLEKTGSEPASSEKAREMLEAHEALVEAHPENLTRFKDVLDYLKQDLQKGSED